MLNGLKAIPMGGREMWPLVEGGKGVAATNHLSSGAWALAGGVGTISAVNADSYDATGRIIPQVYSALTRRERHEELVSYAIEGAVQQVERAYEMASSELQRGFGAININVLWEMGGAQRVLEGVLGRTKGLVNGVTCGTYDEVINVIRASGATVKLTISRKPVTKLLETNMHMELGASSQRTWDEFTFRLYSNRVLTFEKTEPPVVTGEIDVRLALEVRMVDAPNGGGFLEIETASKTFILRSGDTDVLNKWRRELYELLPYLRATEVKCGWLLKKGETSSAGFKPRYCVLFSSYRLLYFDSEACTKRKGAVDLSVAQSVESITTAKGPGFEISTPGRTWVFAACESDAKSTASETAAWMDTLRTMLGDIRERKRKQQISEGVMLLKEGWADLKDESGGGEGAWVGHWFALNSAGELRIFPDAESTQEQMVRR
jgi:hypothetical protein